MDGLDKMCSPCRAEDACIILCETLTDALENFLDDRWFPHEAGKRPAYYRHAPDFGSDPRTYEAEIAAAHHQIVAGVQQLIELAVGRPVVVRSLMQCRDDGFHADVSWSPEEDCS